MPRPVNFTLDYFSAASIQDSTGRVHLFWRDSDRHLCTRHQTSAWSATWTESARISNDILDPIAVAEDQSGRLQVFMIGSKDASLYTRHQTVAGADNWTESVSVSGSYGYSPVQGVVVRAAAFRAADLGVGIELLQVLHEFFKAAQPAFELVHRMYSNAVNEVREHFAHEKNREIDRQNAAGERFEHMQREGRVIG